MIDDRPAYFKTYEHRFTDELLPLTVSYSNSVISEVRRTVRERKKRKRRQPKAKDEASGKPVRVSILLKR